MKVVLLGATGATGRLLARQLVAKKHHVTAIVRNTETEALSGLSADHLKQVRGTVLGMCDESLEQLVQVSNHASLRWEPIPMTDANILFLHPFFLHSFLLAPAGMRCRFDLPRSHHQLLRNLREAEVAGDRHAEEDRQSRRCREQERE